MFNNKIIQLVNDEIDMVSAGSSNNDMNFPTIDFGTEDILGGLKKHKVEEIKLIELNNTNTSNV